MTGVGPLLFVSLVNHVLLIEFDDVAGLELTALGLHNGVLLLEEVIVLNHNLLLLLLLFLLERRLSMSLLHLLNEVSFEVLVVILPLEGLSLDGVALRGPLLL